MSLLLPPQRIDDKIHDATITGCFSPFWKDNQPVVVDLGGDRKYVLVFSSESGLEEAMKVFSLDYDKVFKIADGRDFALSVIGYFDIAIDLRKHTTPEGDLTFRFFQIFGISPEGPAS